MAFQFGLERLLQDKKLLESLKGQRVGLLAHPASVDSELRHSMDLLIEHGVNLTCAFGPQHGLKGDKQDNMIESADETDPTHNIPIFSLYGQVRRPTPEMMNHFDVLLVDLQDVGCRIYTFLTTLFYLLEDAAQFKKQIWVLDRPNPIGRVIEGSLLRPELHSFVGAAPVPMSHGLTLGEAAQWDRHHRNLNVELKVVEMQDYDPTAAPGFGWPEKTWVNPSPNMPRLATARVYCGTVLLEGTLLSEGRGTTIPLEVFGAPGLHVKKIVQDLEKDYAPWMQGLKIREAYFEPTFHKFKGELVSGVQLHAENTFYNPTTIRPYRLVAAFLKLVRKHHPGLPVWRDPPYEYETVKKPFDLLSGSPFLREWIDNESSTRQDLEKYLVPDEKAWREASQKFHLYAAKGRGR